MDFEQDHQEKLHYALARLKADTEDRVENSIITLATIWTVLAFVLFVIVARILFVHHYFSIDPNDPVQMWWVTILTSLGAIIAWGVNLKIVSTVTRWHRHTPGSLYHRAQTEFFREAHCIRRAIRKQRAA